MRNPESEVYKIDGVAMPGPTAVSVSREDLETEAYRDAAGRLHRDRARAAVRKVSFTYDLLDQEELLALTRMLSPVFFQLTYLDAEGARTIEAYCAKLPAELLSSAHYGGLWRGVKFSCIER